MQVMEDRHRQTLLEEHKWSRFQGIMEVEPNARHQMVGLWIVTNYAHSTWK